MGENLIANLYYAGFLSYIFCTRIPSFFTNTVQNWLSTILEIRNEEYFGQEMPLRMMIVSTYPRFDDGYQPARHHIIVDANPGPIEDLDRSVLRLWSHHDSQVFQYPDPEYFSSTLGLHENINLAFDSSEAVLQYELLAETTFESLWVPILHARHYRKQELFINSLSPAPWSDYNAEDDNEVPAYDHDERMQDGNVTDDD